MFNSMKNYFQNYALHKTRDQLMSLSDRQLDDVGISRALLQQGVATWPWREDKSQDLSSQPKMNSREIDSAIRELSRMSDKDLRDIGIDRGTIRQSVISGRESSRAA